MKVHVRQMDGIFSAAKFSDCIFDQLQIQKGKLSSDIYFSYEQNQLKLSAAMIDYFSKCVLSHPSFCPMTKLTNDQITEIPADVIERGVNVGVAIILECSDEKILMTKRASHMRTFPNSWVPPGGHVELNESLLTAGVRELHEETGLNISSNMIKESSVLGMWESVFPPLIQFGLPLRHHIVLYYHILLHKPLKEVSSDITLNKQEVDTAIWLSKNNVNKILNADVSLSQEDLLMHYVDDSGEQYERSLSFSDLTSIASNMYAHKERVTTGTRYALSLWLAGKEKDCAPNSSL